MFEKQRFLVDKKIFVLLFFILQSINDFNYYLLCLLIFIFYFAILIIKLIGN